MFYINLLDYLLKLAKSFERRANGECRCTIPIWTVAPADDAMPEQFDMGFFVERCQTLETIIGDRYVHFDHFNKGRDHKWFARLQKPSGK